MNYSLCALDVYYYILLENNYSNIYWPTNFRSYWQYELCFMGEYKSVYLPSSCCWAKISPKSFKTSLYFGFFHHPLSKASWSFLYVVCLTWPFQTICGFWYFLHSISIVASGELLLRNLSINLVRFGPINH